MNDEFSFTDLSDEVLDRSILASAGCKHTTDARLLAFIAEYDSRRRYVALGYESLRAFCVQALRLREDSAYKRIQAARVAREFPALFPALADGRLCLTAVNLLAPHLSAETADELIAAATHKAKAEIRQLLADRFPKEQPSRMTLLPSPTEAHESEGRDVPSVEVAQDRGADGTQLAPAQVEEVDCWARITPLSNDRYSLSLTIDRATLQLLHHNQALLSHQVPSGNMAEVLRRSLAESAHRFEKRKFRASRTARRVGRATSGSRHIPKHVRDAVWRRDGGQCTFVGEAGHRCGSRTRLEFDHVVPVARGGTATVDNLRLRCRVHNQHEAERVFGADFMRHKLEQAREATKAASRVQEPSHNPAPGPAPAPYALPVRPSAGATAAPRDWVAEVRARATATGLITEREPDVVSVLRHLGLRADQSRELAKLCDTISEAPLEERVRVALAFHGSKMKQGMSRQQAPPSSMHAAAT